MDVKPRVSETDMLGHVNNANYFVYMEEARLEFLKALGMNVSQHNYSFVLASTKCDFKRQVYYDQAITIHKPAQLPDELRTRLQAHASLK